MPPGGGALCSLEAWEREDEVMLGPSTGEMRLPELIVLTSFLQFSHS